MGKPSKLIVKSTKNFLMLLSMQAKCLTHLRTPVLSLTNSMVHKLAWLSQVSRILVSLLLPRFNIWIDNYKQTKLVFMEPKVYAQSMIAEIQDINHSKCETNDELQAIIDRLRMLECSIKSKNQPVVDAFVELAGLNRLTELLKFSNWKVCAITLTFFPFLFMFESSRVYTKNNSNIFIVLWEQITSNNSQIKRQAL